MKDHYKVQEEIFMDTGHKTKGEIQDMEKLKILIKHWIEHNHEHAETYAGWAEKAKAAGNTDLAGMLRKISEKTKKIDELFEKAKRIILSTSV